MKPIMTRDEAKHLAESHLNKGRDLSDPNGGGRIVVSNEASKETPYGWVFSYNSEKFYQTRDRGYCVIGAGPVIVMRSDASVRVVHDSGSTWDKALRNFEKRNGLPHPL